MLSQGWEVPFSPYRLVRAREIEQLVERMRINVPSSIRESERTLQERDRIIAEARAEADRTLQQAKQQAMEMLTERSLVATAQAEAERIIAESREIARRRTDEADFYAVQVLQDLAHRLQTMKQQVDNGVQLMQEQRQPGVEAPAERRARPAANPPRE